MQNLIAHDLLVGRKKSGLTQDDVSVLLEVTRKDVAVLEAGERSPTLLELCKLSLVYNRSFTDYYEHLLKEARHGLFRSLPDLPECKAEGLQRHNRQNTIKRLDSSLTAAVTQRNGAN